MNRKLKLVLGAACAIVCGLSFSARAMGQLVLPEDKGKEEFVHNCTACHRAELVVAAKKTPGDWRKSVDDMAARGTDGTKEDLDNVYLYLVKYYSLDPAAPSPHPAVSPSTPNVSAKMPVSGMELVKRAAAEGTVLSRRPLQQQVASNRAPSRLDKDARQLRDDKNSRLRAFILAPPLL